jgi:hypothetical protein
MSKLDEKKLTEIKYWDAGATFLSLEPDCTKTHRSKTRSNASHSNSMDESCYL